MSKGSKRKNKRIARKKALRTLSKYVTKDSMRAARRKWGAGLGK